MKLIACNRKIENEYKVYWLVEAGLSLCGYQVKLIRKGNVSLSSVYGYMDGRSVFVRNLFESDVRLLLNKNEIRKIIGLYSRDKRVMVVKDMYDKKGKIKITLVLGEKFTKHDHRRKLMHKDERRRSKLVDYY